jgi:type I restriction enzyme M protein
LYNSLLKHEEQSGMQWIAPSEKDAATDTLEKRLWAAAGQSRANSGLSAAQYSQPVLGLIFLRFSEVRFAKQRAKLEKTSASTRRGSRVDEPAAYQANGILYLAPNARFDYLLNLPESVDIGKKLNDAMRDIEKNNTQLAGVLRALYREWFVLFRFLGHENVPRVASPLGAFREVGGRFR